MIFYYSFSKSYTGFTDTDMHYYKNYYFFIYKYIRRNKPYMFIT